MVMLRSLPSGDRAWIVSIVGLLAGDIYPSLMSTDLEMKDLLFPASIIPACVEGILQLDFENQLLNYTMHLIILLLDEVGVDAVD